MYYGKTNCCAEKRMLEHALKPEQPMFQHFEGCDSFQHHIALMNLGGIENEEELVSHRDYCVPAVLDNYKVVKTVHNSALLALTETYFVQKHKPVINDGLKSCVDFRVFDF